MNIEDKIEFINKELEKRYDKSISSSESTVKGLLKQLGFPVKTMVGSSHTFVCIIGILTIKVKRKKIQTSKFNNYLSYVKLVPSYIREEYKYMEVSDMLDMQKQNESQKSQKYDLARNKQIEDFKKLLASQNISVNTVNTVFKAIKGIKSSKFQYEVGRGDLNEDLDSYKVLIKID